MSVPWSGDETVTWHMTMRSLMDRLGTLAPALDRNQIKSMAAHVSTELGGLVAQAMPPARAHADLDDTMLALAPSLTDTDLAILLLHGRTSATAARLLLANFSPRFQEAALDALAVRRVFRDRPLQSLSTTFTEALARVSSGGGGPTPARDQLKRIRKPEPHDEAALLEAAQDGDEERVAGVLAAASGLPVAAIRQAAEFRNAKALVSLIWKSGFSTRAGIVVQSLLGQLPPSKLLGSGPTGGYPLSREEMEWQIELMAGRVPA